MPADTDIASAARRVAEDIRFNVRFTADLSSLLTVLDAVAAGQGDEGRVERWARAMCADADVDPDGRYSPTGEPWWKGYAGSAQQAMALADAERAVATVEGWAAYEAARAKFEEAIYEAAVDEYAGCDRDGKVPRSSAFNDARTALDAAVRCLAGAA